MLAQTMSTRAVFAVKCVFFFFRIRRVFALAHTSRVDDHRARSIGRAIDEVADSVSVPSRGRIDRSRA